MAEQLKQEGQQPPPSVDFKDETIGMVYDKKNGQAQVFSKTQNTDGSYAMTSPDADPQTFLVLHGNVPEVFIKNLVKNHREPKFDVFLFPRNMLKSVKESLGNYMKKTKSDAVKLLYKHKVTPNGKFKISVKGNNIPEDQIPWDDLAKYGISYGNLDYDPKRQQYGHLDKMCRLGDPSAGLVNIHYNEGVANITDNMKLRFTRENGNIRVKMAGVIQKPQYEFLGVKFSDEGRKALNTTGNLGYILDTPEGEFFVSRDCDTLRLTGQRTDNVVIQKWLNGHIITDTERERLQKGQIVNINNMTNAKGQKFAAKYQYSAVYRRLEQILTPSERYALACDFAHERDMQKAAEELSSKATQTITEDAKAQKTKDPKQSLGNRTQDQKPRPQVKPQSPKKTCNKSKHL